MNSEESSPKRENKSWAEYGELITTRLKKVTDPDSPTGVKINIADLLRTDAYQEELFRCWKDIYDVFLEARVLWNEKMKVIGQDTIQNKYHEQVQIEFIKATHKLIAYATSVNPEKRIDEPTAERLFSFCTRIIDEVEQLPSPRDKSGDWQNAFLFTEIARYLLSDYAEKYPHHASQLKGALRKKNVPGLP